MKKFFQNAFTKLKDYFTANSGRKIFFFGGLTALIGLISYIAIDLCLPGLKGDSLYFPLQEFNHTLWYLVLIGFVVAAVGTLWDTMYTRYLFLKKVRDMQYEHVKAIYDQQDAGEFVEMTPTFSGEEKKYLQRRKWNFVLIILFKLGIVIALFSLLLGV